MIRPPKDRERLHRKVGVVFILVLLLLSFAFPLTNAPSMRSASATRQDYGLESSSGLGTQVKGLVGHVFLGGDGTSESSDQILTSTIKSGTPFKKFMHNGNPTIWGPYDNEVDALPIEYAIEGDFVFAVNLEDSVSAPYSFDRMEVWIPPEFQGIKKEHIVASFTDNWGNLPSAIRADVDAITFPNRWTRIRANSDSGLDGLTTGRYIQFGNKSLGDVWAYIRVNKVVAPTIAGKYFFKMGLRVADPIPAGSSTNVNAGEMIWLGSPEKPYQTFLSNGVANWPTVTVKSEIDPAYVEGTLRYGGNSGPIYYGQALQLAGRVRLVGRAIDPNTLQPTNRPVEARGYMNASANGHFEIQGVPAGIYDIYASAAGYPEKLIQTNIRILKAQSYHLDGYLTPGVIIDGEVFSKCGTGAINWVTWQDSPDESPAITAQDIKIEIYKLGDVPAAGGGVYEGMQENVDGSSLSLSTQPLAWSPVSTPTKLGSSTGVTAGWGDIPMGFPWPGYGGKYAKGFDPDGVGPPQRWRVESSSSGFRFRFGEKGLYGAPTLLDGHVPQLNATWIDGVAPGSYEVRAFTYGYVQTKADGETFEHVTFSIPAVEFPGDVFVPFDLRLSSYVRKTVHFHDVSGTFAEKPIPGKGQEFRYLYLEVLGVGSTMWGWKVNRVAAGSTSATISSRGIRGQTMSYWGSGSGRDYGFNAGDYVIRAYMYGYVEDIASRIPIGLCGGEIGLSGHMYRGVMFNVTVQSSDWQHPSVNKPWKYPNEYIYLQIGKSGRQLTGYGLNRLMGRDF